MLPIHILRKPCCQPCSSHILHNSPQVVLSHYSSFLLNSSTQPEIRRVTNSPSPTLFDWILATLKSSDLELAAVASLVSVELPLSNGRSLILFNESSQATVSQPSVQDDGDMGDSPSSVGVTKEIAVAVKESSRPVKKRIGQRTPAPRMSSGNPPRKPTAPCLVTSKK